MLRIPDAPPWRTSERVVENRSLGEVSCGHKRGFHGPRGTRSVPVRALCLFVLCAALPLRALFLSFAERLS